MTDFRSRLSLWSFGRGRRLSLLLPGLDAEARTRFELTLNRLLKKCGCSWAAAFMLIAVGSAIAYRVWNASELSFSYVAMSVLVVSAVALPAGLVGKFLGLVLARRSFRRVCNELRTALAARSSHQQKVSAQSIAIPS